MVAFLILAHAPLASALLCTAEHAFGAGDEALAAIDVEPGDDPAVVESRARDCLAAWQARCAPAPLEVLVLCDVLGATPSNIAQRLLDHEGRAGLVGVNVPMLWRALHYRDLSLAGVLEKARTGALAGVQVLESGAGVQRAVLSLAPSS